MVKLIPVKGNSNIMRDETTQAILNVNNNEFKKYIKGRDLDRQKTKEFDELKKDVSDLKTMMEKLCHIMMKNENI